MHLLIISVLLCSLPASAESGAFKYSEKNFNFETLSAPKYKSEPASPDLVVNNSQNVRIVRQTINNIPVYGSFIKTISNGPALTLEQSYTLNESASLRENSNKKTSILDISKAQNTLENRYGKIRIEFQEKVYFFENNSLVPTYVIYFSNTAGEVFESFFTSDGALTKVQRTGSQFADVNADVYSKGPKLDTPAEQLLKHVTANPTLNNEWLRVDSESDKKILNTTDHLKFDLKDDRFDQVQVFFYMNKAFNWIQENLGTQLHGPIEAVVYMGFPEKTNSAFYFRNKIRLGKGDDLFYSNIAHDSSIVFHESFHVLIDQLTRLPFENQGGSLNEAFADFFTCLMTGSPHLGESSYLKGPFKRSLENVVRLDEKTGGLYHDSLIVSGLLWEAKQKIDAEKIKKLAFQVLLHMNSQSDFTSFNKKILEFAPQILSKQEYSVFSRLLKNRGFLYE